MIINEKIPIKNIYYMLAYAYETIKLSEYKEINLETFENVEDLYAEILLIGLPVLIRGGLIKDYIEERSSATVIRGKIDINSSIKQNALARKKLIVVYDEFSEDILLNQIIKSTLVYLSRSERISKEKRRKFFGFIMYFSNVSDVELTLNLWKKVKYNSQNIRYQFLVDICRFLYEELLISEGIVDIGIKIDDEQRLSSLYEKFVYAFYKKETTYKVEHPQIKWNVDDGFTDALPVMQTDIVLKNENKTLIIDTKFYSENMSKKYEGGIAKQNSSNLYQIYTYVKNWIPKNEEVVSGMLLYARTTAEEQPKHHYKINGNLISVISIDLNKEFEEIRNNLINIAGEILQ